MRGSKRLTGLLIGALVLLFTILFVGGVSGACAVIFLIKALIDGLLTYYIISCVSVVLCIICIIFIIKMIYNIFS